MMSWP
jgi:hypothetical protein